MDETLIATLAELDAAGVLILAALQGRIVEIKCQMPACACPHGRDYFEKKGDPRRNLWAPSADRWPIPGRDGGEYVAANVRLAHSRCNMLEGGHFGGEARARGGLNGEQNPHSRLNQLQVEEIRRGLEGGALATATYTEIGRRYGTSSDVIKHIADGTHWGVRGLPKIVRQRLGAPLPTSAWRKERRGPEFENKRRAAMTAFWASPAGNAERAARAERVRRQWADAEVRQRMSTAIRIAKGLPEQ